MAERYTRGLETKHEQRAQELIRDTRTLSQRFFAVTRDPQNAAIILSILAAIPLFYPQLIDVLFAFGLFLFTMAITNRTHLPYRLPKRAKKLDFNDPQPGSHKPNMARGICFLGNEIGTNQELWFNNEDMRTHILIFGSTGSGKTEALVSLAYNSLLQGSGLIYVDGKGDNSLYSKIFSMCRSMGRDDDLLVVNFMTGARDIVGPQKTRLSNTMNPFARGSSAMLAQLVISMLSSSDGPGASPDADMWKDRAISFIEALMKILVYMRDQGELLLDAHSLRGYFNLPKLETIGIDKKFPLPDNRVIDISKAPDVVVEPIINYLENLPGYQRAKKGAQAAEVLEQHGFITMQLTRVFTSLADTYGHIIRTNLAEVDFRDVVLNRRILVVLLPALEKSPEELSNLGKIIVASLKGMMASGLGEEVEGTYQDVIERKITNSPTPFLCILDEYGYYAVKGFSVVPAQARSLGFSAIFAGQDLPAFEKVSKEEAMSIGANTNIKICMKLEDPTTTYEFFQKTAGQAYVTQTSGFQTNNNSMTNSYLDSKNTQIEKRDRIDLLDLKDQRQGEAHIFFKSRIVRANMFFANPPPPKHLKINQFLKVSVPREDVLMALDQRFGNFERLLMNPAPLSKTAPLDEDLQAILSSFRQRPKDHPQRRSLRAVSAICHQESKIDDDIPEEAVEEESTEGMDIFTQSTMDIPDMEDLDPLSLLSIPALVGPLLDKREAKRNIEKVQRFLGKTKHESSEISAKLIQDLRIATHYPPEHTPEFDESETCNTIHELITHFNELTAKKAAEKEGKGENKDGDGQGDGGEKKDDEPKAKEKENEQDKKDA